MESDGWERRRSVLKVQIAWAECARQQFGQRDHRQFESVENSGHIPVRRFELVQHLPAAAAWSHRLDPGRGNSHSGDDAMPGNKRPQRLRFARRNW